MVNLTEAAKLVDRMQGLWTEWEPTADQIDVWAGVFTDAPSADDAWKALQGAYAVHGHYRKPRVGYYREALAALRPAADQGVHAQGGDPTQRSPYFIMEVDTHGRFEATGKKPRISTWAYPHQLPGDEEMLQDARGHLTRMERLYSKAEWIIEDARAPGVGVSDYVKALCWRLLNREETA